MVGNEPMSERDQLKNGLLAQFAFLTSAYGFHGPKTVDHSLLLTLLYRSDSFNVEIIAELRDWYLDFQLLPPEADSPERGFGKRIRSYDLIKPVFSSRDEALFNQVTSATTPRDAWGSVPAMLDSAEHLAALLHSLMPRLRARADRLFSTRPPDPA